MIRRFILLSVACGVIIFSAATASTASAQIPVPSIAGGAGAMGGPGAGYGNQQAFGQAWGGSAANVDWNRFYHYPYVYYPQNFWGQEYFKSSDSLYHRYPTEMRIPVYNKKWHNYYPSNRRFHQGHHFILDTF